MDQILANYASSGSSSDEEDEQAIAVVIHVPACNPPPPPHQPQRTRTFPHIPGNFAVHVFVDIPPPAPAIQRPIDNLLHHLQTTQFPSLEPSLQSTTTDPTTNASSYHISLSRTVPIRLSTADALLTTLRTTLLLSLPHKFTIRIHPSHQVYTNDEKTRTFLALQASSSCPSSLRTIASNSPLPPTTSSCPMVTAIHALSYDFEVFNLPPFYPDPRLHVSIASVVGDHHHHLTQALMDTHADEKSNSSSGAISTGWSVEPRSIYCTIGNKRHVVWKCP